MCALRFDHLCGMREKLFGCTLTSTFLKEAGLKMGGDEDELHRRLGFGHKRLDQAPGSYVVEVHIRILPSDSVATDVWKVWWLCGVASRIQQIEADVCVPAAAV